MATYEVTTEDGNTYEVETDDSPIKKAVTDAVKNIGGSSLAAAKEVATMGPTAQKTASAMMPVVGGLAGMPFGLGAPGAALGELGRQAANTVIAPEDVPKTPLGRFASVAGAGIMQDPKILKAIPGVPQVSKMASELASKTASKVGGGLAKAAQAFSGGKAGDFAEGAKKGVKTYLAPSTEEAGAKMGQAIDNLPREMEFIPPPETPPAKLVYGDEAKPLVDEFGKVMQKPPPPEVPWKGPVPVAPTLKETVQAALVPESSAGNKMLVDLAEKIDAGDLPTARQALKAKQALDDVIDTVPFWQRKRRAKLFDLKATFDDVLSNQSGELKAASNEYRAAALKRNLTKFLPVNKHGEYSRLAPMLSSLIGATGGVVGGSDSSSATKGALGTAGYLLGTSPLALGALATGGGSAVRGLNSLAQNPAARQALLQILQRITQKKEAKENALQ